MDENEMLCRDANGNVYREAFRILGLDGLYFILIVSGGILLIIFIVIYCSNSKEDPPPPSQAPVRAAVAFRPAYPPRPPLQQYPPYPTNYYGPGPYRRF